MKKILNICLAVMLLMSGLITVNAQADSEIVVNAHYDSESIIYYSRVQSGANNELMTSAWSTYENTTCLDLANDVYAVFSVNVSQAGWYSLELGAGSNSDTSVGVSVNSAYMGKIEVKNNATQNGSNTEGWVSGTYYPINTNDGNVWLEEGENRITLRGEGNKAIVDNFKLTRNTAYTAQPPAKNTYYFRDYSAAWSSGAQTNYPYLTFMGSNFAVARKDDYVIQFDVSVPTAGWYNVDFRYGTPSSSIKYTLSVNSENEPAIEYTTEANAPQYLPCVTTPIGKIYLNKGRNNIRWHQDKAGAMAYKQYFALTLDTEAQLHTLKQEINPFYAKSVKYARDGATNYTPGKMDGGMYAYGNGEYTYLVNVPTAGEYDVCVDYKLAGVAETNLFNFTYTINGVSAENPLKFHGTGGTSIASAGRVTEKVSTATLSEGGNIIKITTPGLDMIWYNITFEKPFGAVYSGETEITAVQDGNLVAKLDPTCIIGSELAVFAIYANDKLVAVKTEKVSGKTEMSELRIDNFTTEIGNNYDMKIFLWDSKNDGICKEIKDNHKGYYVSESGSESGDGSYNNPFVSIGQAKKAIAAISDTMTEDIVVNILPGYYQLDETEIFDETHSGKNGFNIIYRGTSYTNPPIISGGTKITGWTEGENGIWKAPAPIEDTRTLYINGYPAQRAQSKYKYECAGLYTDEGSQYQYDGILVKSKNFISDYENPENLEIAWPLYWTWQRTPVKDVIDEGEYTRIVMDQPAFHNSFYQPYYGIEPTQSAKFVVENAKELLDEPGEFYFDKAKKEIYYYPFKNEDLTTAETYCGTTEFLIKTKGSGIESKVENLVFENLDFRYGAWNDASERGVSVQQADRLAADQMKTGKWTNRCMPAQFEMEYAKNITVKDCRFTALGSGGISMFNAVSDSKVIGNVFSDISGTAVIIGSFEHESTLLEGEERVTNIEVSHNVIRRVANEFYNGCGMSIYWPTNINVHHNDIEDVPYTGMTVGWGWTADKVPEASGIKITDNRIANTNDTVRDGAHIYTLGVLKDCYIERNYLIKSHDWRGGLYLDAGSSYLTLTENVVEDVDLWFMCLADGLHTDVTAVDNFVGEADNKSSNASEPVDYNTVTEVGTFYKGDGEWPERALEIMAGVGPQGGYKSLKSKAQLPAWRTNWIHDYQTEAFKVPGEVWTEAEDFMPGGEGITWHSKEFAKPWAFKYGGILETVLGRMSVGDWQTYEVEIPEDGEYNFLVNGASEYIGGGLNVYVDGKQVISKGQIGNTDTWEIYEVHNLGKVNMTKGRHIIKTEYSGAFNFNKFRFAKASEVDSYEDSIYYDEGVVVPEIKLDYSDIEGHAAYDEIVSVLKKGIMTAVGDTKFAPDAEMTLYQAVQAAMNTVNIKYTEENWKEIAAAYGLLKSKTEADGVITRERFAQMMLKAAETRRILYIHDDKVVSYSDAGSISSEYKEAVDKLSSYGVFGDATSFNPKNTLLRSEAAVIMANVYELFAK